MEIRGTNKWRDFCEKNETPKNLVYTTIGYSKSYARCVELFLKTLVNYSNPIDFDILIICDEGMFEDISDMAYTIFDNEILRNKLFFLVAPNSDSAMKASMHKLNIFDFPRANDYRNIVFVDVDVLCLHDMSAFFERMDKCIVDEKKEYLYACNERDDPLENKTLWWCMNDYTEDDMEFFKKNHILPFNAGMFAFRYSKAMKEHFKNVMTLIRTSPKVYFFEQAYMNAYFNRKNLVRYDLVSKENYIMFPDLKTLYKDKIVHFCGHPGNGDHKYSIMKEYVSGFDLLRHLPQQHNGSFTHSVLRNRNQVIL